MKKSITALTSIMLKLVIFVYDNWKIYKGFNDKKVDKWFVNLLTATKCPTATAKPMDKGADPCRSLLFPSMDARTVNTRTKVIITSTPNPWASVTSPCMALTPSPARALAGVRPNRIAAPTIAPIHWHTIYIRARTMLTRLVTRAPNVMAGLIWPPLTWAIPQTIVPTMSPKASAICT